MKIRGVVEGLYLRFKNACGKSFIINIFWGAKNVKL